MSTKSARLRQRLTINPDAPAPAPPVADPAPQQPVDETTAPETGPEAAQDAEKPQTGTRKRAATKAAQKPTQGETGASAEKKPARPAPTMLTAATTAEAKRVGLYLHPDDFRALGIAKLDDGADANARVRAMIALWRHNDRYRAAVDKLARTAPRGPNR